LNVQSTNGETPLHRACRFGNIEFIHLLLTYDPRVSEGISIGGSKEEGDSTSNASTASRGKVPIEAVQQQRCDPWILNKSYMTAYDVSGLGGEHGHHHNTSNSTKVNAKKCLDDTGMLILRLF
jgi:ankyrin repeat protein